MAHPFEHPALAIPILYLHLATLASFRPTATSYVLYHALICVFSGAAAIDNRLATASEYRRLAGRRIFALLKRYKGRQRPPQS